MPARRGLAVFQSHGTDDPILPYSLAERLHSAWRSAGADARFISFPGAHGIPQPVLDAFGAFLRERLT